MPKYQVNGTATISMHTVVEADSPEEAKEIAQERAVQGLCHGCANARGADEEWRTNGELDGEPGDLEVEEI